MASSRISLIELLRKAQLDENVDFLREAIGLVVQMLIDNEASQAIGAEPYERSPGRRTQRNGSRLRRWDTRVGTVELKVPKLRQGSFFPSLLEPRRRTERALLSVIQEAYVHGVSTRKVDDLVKALGMNGISRSEVSRICLELDEQVQRFRNRPLLGEYPYLWLDATFHKVREAGQVHSMALVVAVGVRSTGEREVLGLDLGPSEDGAFWLEFLRGLLVRGLSGIRLVISDGHQGLRAAIGQTLYGAAWQRCRVHFMRNVLTHVPKMAQQMVAASIRTIFAQPDQAQAHRQLQQVATSLAERFSRVSDMLREAEDDILAHMAFPNEHWRQIHSTNPLERLNKEIKRRTGVVGIFPNRDSVLRLVGAVLSEQNDEWSVGRRYFSQESMARLNRNDPEPQQLATSLVRAS